jgi:sugar/nucleoside kinase (ribokinase family)
MANDSSLRKDTTGCGDNFMGGVPIAITQLLKSGKEIDLDMKDLKSRRRNNRR